MQPNATACLPSPPWNERLAHRLWSYVDADGDCWLWKRTPSAHGYGIFCVGQGRYSVHRVVYEWLVGPIEPGLVIDHLCRVRHCVNPDHMEPVSVLVNTNRGYGRNAGKAKLSHCPKGHLYTPENTMVSKTGKSGRHCRTCKREMDRKAQILADYPRMVDRVAALEAEVKALREAGDRMATLIEDTELFSDSDIVEIDAAAGAWRALRPSGGREGEV